MFFNHFGMLEIQRGDRQDNPDPGAAPRIIVRDDCGVAWRAVCSGRKFGGRAPGFRPTAVRSYVVTGNSGESGLSAIRRLEAANRH